MPATVTAPAKGAKFTLLLASTLPILAVAVVSPALPGIQEEFAGVPRVRELTRLVLVLPALFVVIAAPWEGVVADRFGRKPLLLGSLVLYALAGSSGAWAPGLGMLLAGRAALGVAVAGVMTAATTLLADVSAGTARRHLLAAQAAYVGTTSGIFLAGGGFLATLHWRTTFLVYLVALLLVLPAVHWVPRTIVAAPRSRRTSRAGRLPSRSLLPLFAMIFGTQLIFYLSPLLLPFHLRELGDPSAANSGMVLSLLAFTYGAAAMLAPVLAERMRPALLYGLGFVLCGLAYVGLAAQRSTIAMLPSMIATGVGLGFLIPSLYFAIAEAAPLPVRGRAMGMMTTVVFLGQFLTPVLVSPVVASFGMAGAFAVVGTLSVALAVVIVAAASVRMRSQPGARHARR